MNAPDNSIRTGRWQPAQSELPVSDPVAVEMPQQIGRYLVQRLLGEGGFGRVYQAHEGKLNRCVAIKVLHRKLIARPEDAEAYLAEAQNVANLDHPKIVPVFDVGSTEDCPCFIVSKFIEGSTLARRIKEVLRHLIMRTARDWFKLQRNTEVPMQKKYVVRLTKDERSALAEVIKKLQGTSQKVRRAQGEPLHVSATLRARDGEVVGGGQPLFVGLKVGFALGRLVRRLLGPRRRRGGALLAI
jgi:hypothetical protein